MSKKLPVLFTLTGTDTPLDLSVRKPEMEHTGTPEYSHRRSSTPERSLSLPQRLDYSQLGPSRSPVFGENHYSDESFYSLAVSSNNVEQRSHSSPGFLSHGEDQDVDTPSYSGSPNFGCESGIIPKKRKNLWRPYDSKSKLEDNDKDSDSSDSNLSSDHEFRVPFTPPPPSDPVKKRKFDMLRYTAQQEPDVQDSSLSNSPVETGGYDDVDSVEHDGNKYIPVQPDEALSKAQMSLLNNFPESRDKMISGMKKRDIFGWSLKLSSPMEGTEIKHDEKDRAVDTVCKDGEKTYFELQTVKKNPCPSVNARDCEPHTNMDINNAAKISPRSPKSIKDSSSPNRVQTLTSKKRNAKDESEKENVSKDSENLVSKKVYIHGRDNVVETYDETQNVSKKSATSKGLSLIDLIEEIEADAVKEKNEQSEIERQIKNRRVAALLKQCNNVKLTALDFLMSNVLIEDSNQKRNTKNANIQKMLNGDKINSVSLLDIMEMQVEVGLS